MNDDIAIDPTMRAVAAQYFDRVENRPVPRSLTLAEPSFGSARRGFRLVRGLAAVALFVAISVALTIVILVTRNLAATSPAHPQAPQLAPSSADVPDFTVRRVAPSDADNRNRRIPGARA